jgi:hypothetical protein
LTFSLRAAITARRGRLLIGSLYRFRNKLRLSIVNHVANLRKQPENAVHYFLVEADSLAFDIHDTILGARHDYDGHNQPARHRLGPRRLSSAMPKVSERSDRLPLHSAYRPSESRSPYRVTRTPLPPESVKRWFPESVSTDPVGLSLIPGPV